MCNERRIGSVESEVLSRAVNFNSYSSGCEQELFETPVSQASNLPYIQLQPRISPKSYFFHRVLFLTLCQNHCSQVGELTLSNYVSAPVYPAISESTRGKSSLYIY